VQEIPRIVAFCETVETQSEYSQSSSRNGKRNRLNYNNAPRTAISENAILSGMTTRSLQQKAFTILRIIIVLPVVQRTAINCDSLKSTVHTAVTT
jgi:hypothetical protein